MEFPALVRHKPCFEFQTTCSRDLLFFKQFKCCRLRGSRYSYRKVEGRSLFSRERIDKRMVHSSMLKAYLKDSPSMERSFESQKKLDDFHLKDVNWPSPEDEIPFWKKEFPPFDSDLHSAVNESKDSDLLHVIHVTAEMAPIAKVGGLGDVVTGLSRACLLRGHTVNIMLPFYQCIPRNQISCLELVRQYKSFFNDSWVETNAYCGKVSGIPVTLIEPSNQFFKGQSVYGGSYNELEAYLFFSRACLEYLQVSGIQPDIIHVHEWQMGAIPLLYWDMYHQLAIQKPRLVLTIHNMEHYGECRQEQLSFCGLDAPIYAVEEKAVDDRTIGHNPERLSLLKGGIVYSNAVVTVSPTYLKETLCSGWLASTLMRHQEKYFGIVNGVDTVMWNPEIDVFLPFHFSAEDIKGKSLCKYYVQRGLGLEPEKPGVPLCVCITRLVAQKGLHLIRYALKRIEELGGQMVILGKAPDARINKEFEDLRNAHSGGNRIRILLTYSEELSHMLYAAADIILVPSMYEPCGLSQMIGMRYGAVPIVRKTGGLADTVFDLDDESNHGKGNGFVFEGIDEGSFNKALERAFRFYKEKPDLWRDVVMKVMKVDNSWNNTAGKYIDVYNSVRVRG